MEPCKSTVAQWIPIVQPNQLHEHVGDKHTEVLDIAQFVLQRHDLHVGLLGPCSFGR
jgi:hypothetical protein